MLDPDNPSNPAESRLFTDDHWYAFLKQEKRKRRWRGYLFRLFMVLVWLGVPLLTITLLDMLKTFHQ